MKRTKKWRMPNAKIVLPEKIVTTKNKKKEQKNVKKVIWTNNQQPRNHELCLL